MPVIHTETITPDKPLPGGATFGPAYQTYCGLDCCLTLEIHEELVRTHPQPNPIYDFERALQAPYLEIMQRGFRVDELSRRSAARELRVRLDAMNRQLNEFAEAFWDKPFERVLVDDLGARVKTDRGRLVREGYSLNAFSPKQLQQFFYGAMKIPEIWISQKGERKLSLNREVLEKIEKEYLYARPIVGTILLMRDFKKQLDVLETEIDPDGRFRAAYNIAGTETGRPSSSSNAYGTGGNAQNIAPGLRFIFVADPGYKMCVIDLEQVEARDVGFFCGCLFDDWKFLDNCESGDLHTNNCKLIWAEKGWTGDAKLDKDLAETNFYREFSHRDMSKRGGHLSNYMGTAWTAARSLKVPIGIMEEFQARYCRGGTVRNAQGELVDVEPAFPAIPRYWQWVAQQLQTVGHITTPFGRRRHFFGRPDDDTTLREAIAYTPQSTTADRMNLGLWRTWAYEPRAKLLAQTYDSITFQYLESEDEDDLISNVLRLLEVELFAPSGRRFVVPGEAKIGWNWARAHDPTKPFGPKNRPNPEGLIKWKLGRPDLRVRPTGLARIGR